MISARFFARPFQTALVAAALFAGPVGAAQAQRDTAIDVNADGQLATRSLAVQTADLNTGSTAGKARLDTRLRVAARTVCQDTGMWGLRPPADFVHCYDRAVADARAQVGSGSLRQAGAGGAIRVTAR